MNRRWPWCFLSLKYDWMMVKTLESPVPIPTPLMPLSQARRSSLRTRSPRLRGYPLAGRGNQSPLPCNDGTPPPSSYRLQFVSHADGFERIRSRYLRLTEVTFTLGNSGGPMMTVRNSNPYVAGVQSGSSDSGTQAARSVGVRARSFFEDFHA